MTVLFPIFGIALVLWALLYFRHGSMILGGVLFLSLGYVFTNNFWNIGFGPVSLNVARVILLGLVAMFVYRLWERKLERRPLTGSDWLGGLLIAYITGRFLLTSDPIGEASDVAPTWRLIASFWMPAVLFVSMRYAELTERSWKLLLGCLSVFGLYLALTSLAEVHGQWWAVFPRFISDPTLGTHFGRARGPQLMSASLGIFLTICFWAAWFLWARVGRVGKAFWAGAMMLMLLGVYYTFTRSTWLGLAGGLTIIPLLHWPRAWRPILLGGIVVVGSLGLMTVGGSLLDLGRKDTDASASHSVYQRASFLYISKEMFKDHPLLGCGFGRFYDQKMSYLSDRRQQIELESIRNLDHHNTLLSILVETGAVGLVLFLGTLCAWFQASVELFRDTSRDSWERMHGLFSIAALITYLGSALFHDLTLSPTEHWYLCLIMGLTIGLQSRKYLRVSGVERPELARGWGSSALPQTM